MKNSRKIWGVIIFSLLLIGIVIFSCRTTILESCGKFMAPTGIYTADVAILEGTESISRGMVAEGIKLLSSRKVQRLIVVLHRIAPSHRPFALNEDYPGLVKKELETLGLKEKDFKIIVTHIHEPITLTAAKGAMEILFKDNVRTAILLSDNFHTRRSFLVYQHIGASLHIKIFPSACFRAYQRDHWWLQEGGVRDFSYELIKLIYYLVQGYIPFDMLN